METSTLFCDKSDIYASSRPSYPKALFEYICSLVPKRDEAWDCATGNGQAAIGLAKYFSSVAATDISKEQIANAFPCDNIEYSVSAGESTHFGDNQFDLVNVAQALHWFDFEAYWDEVSRVLKPNGAFVTYSYAWPSLTESLDQIVEKKVKDVVAPYWAPNNKLVWDSYSSVEFPFEREDAPTIDLENHWSLEQFLSYLHTWSGVRRCMDDIGSEFFEDAKSALESEWGDPNTRIAVKHPLTIIAGKAW